MWGKLFDAISVSVLLGMSLNVVIPLMICYVTGADRIIFEVNRFGELPYEAVLFPLFLIMAVITWVRLMRR